MKLDPKIMALLATPFIALLACVIMSFVLPDPKPFAPARPDFLNYIDQLSVSSENYQKSTFAEGIRNVFSHEKPVDDVPAEVIGDTIVQPIEHPPVSVSMLVAGSVNSFSVINGKKMRVGERSGSFTLTAIRKNSVTVRHLDGIEETIHVKAY